MKLNGTWKLYYEPEHKGMAVTPDAIGAMPCIDAQVPGNVEMDLVRAGLEEHPFWDQYLYAYRKYEFYHWWFVREFDVPAEFEGEMAELLFHGVNTIADVFVNGIKVGSCDNMMIEHAFRVEEALKVGEKNTLAVHIFSAVNYARNNFDIPMGASAGEHTDEFSVLRMPPHSFGWDIMPRLVSAGMWRGVELNVLPANRIKEAYYGVMEANEKQVQLKIKCRFVTDDPMLENLSVRVVGVCGDHTFEWKAPALFTSLDGNITIENPKLWWPKGYGEQNLYTVTMELLKEDQVLASRTERIGLRRFIIEHVMKPYDGEFKVWCNGVFILCKGSNWVPASALHAEDAGRYEKNLALWDDMGCNIIRCWGGNVVEDHKFYDICDEMGLMVWQDFTMACATYPQERWFFDTIDREASAIVKKLRNHASILLWAGDNEVDERLTEFAYPDDANRHNDITRDILPRVIRNHDPYRKFLPSSPFIPEYFPRYAVPEQHNWGARAYFKDDFYKHTNAHFISECGYHGCPSPASLAKFIPEDNLWPWHNNSWTTHNTDNLMNVPRFFNRNDLMADQVRILIGHIPETLEEYATISQISQAEAKKFFVERTRIKKGKRTGIIWWNMIDGWPQISDAIVDYYYEKKLAYTWLKRVHTPVCLMVDELYDWGHDVVLGNDGRKDYMVKWSVEDGDTGEVLLSGETKSPANENVVVGNFRELAGMQKFYILKWSIDGVEQKNHYISGFPPYKAETLLSWAEKIKNL